jgi:hypothetical protein
MKSECICYGPCFSRSLKLYDSNIISATNSWKNSSSVLARYPRLRARNSLSTLIVSFHSSVNDCKRIDSIPLAYQMEVSVSISDIGIVLPKIIENLDLTYRAFRVLIQLLKKSEGGWK